MRNFSETEMTGINEQLQTIFGSNMKVLSFNTIHRRLNVGKEPHTPGYVTSRQLSRLLKNNNGFQKAEPRTTGSNKWYEKQSDDKKKEKRPILRKQINLWTRV